MAFTLIIGPMKSGKSLELIARVAPYKFADKKVLFLQPVENVRDEGVQSRSGLNVEAVKVASLAQINQDFDVIGIDEIHMFTSKDSQYIDGWLRDGKEVFVSGLDLDYQGILIPIMQQLMQLKPDNIINKVAVCDVCRKYGAAFTQILHESEPVMNGLPPVVPDDGTYIYEARCRDCFVNNRS